MVLAKETHWQVTPWKVEQRHALPFFLFYDLLDHPNGAQMTPFFNRTASDAQERRPGSSSLDYS